MLEFDALRELGRRNSNVLGVIERTGTVTRARIPIDGDVDYKSLHICLMQYIKGLLLRSSSQSTSQHQKLEMKYLFVYVTQSGRASIYSEWTDKYSMCGYHEMTVDGMSRSCFTSTRN